ncbi:MAG: glycoside hydrolase/phage tail family protein, partial [Hyphomicrobium aestuarii]|nr:glycoside hydrolase/phage tail family protein [Hyphomicrobium aestuarii]
TLALAAVGSAIGGALLPSGIGALGVSLSGAALGSQVGTLAGSYIDQALFGSSGRTRNVQGPRISDLQVVASTEGAAIPRVYGRVRVGGQIIWATTIEERATTTTSQAQRGGKGAGGGGGGGTATTTTAYAYFSNFAVALTEGEIGGIGRVWANGTELDLSQITHRVYTGSDTQAPDSLISARMGASVTPAYRGTAYVVFEGLALAPFGNRMPQLSFEVYRPIEPFAKAVRAVVMIPGAGEFVYDPSPVIAVHGTGGSTPENTHTRQGGTDWQVSLDSLSATLPNVNSVSLIVSWFGMDLRAGSCQLRPGVDRRDKSTSPYAWSVAGQTRANAHLVSEKDGRPAYGGTPSDTSVVAAIRDLKSRGHAVTFTPFILMDIADGNALPNPHGSASQPSYPWRGRITLAVAPGRPGTTDKTPAAASELATFIGTASPAQFSLSGDLVIYSGPTEWSYRRMVLHQAMLAKAAGGVDTFVLGTELRGLTVLRSGPTTFPFVAALIALAADVKAILGPATNVTYAADWSEYFGYHPTDVSGDVLFHLDPLWASPSIDAIGIDLYWPLSDWRDGRNHIDYLAGTRQIHDLDYLRSNVTGGEGFDWYYANDANRQNQVRTPITDGLGKPWVYRYKDIRAWWQNTHHNRIAGVESPTPTSWVPQSKPFWFLEIGCGAVDKASNEPNVFVDPKSSENALPRFSRGTRDDLIQRRYLQAITETFDPADPGYAGHNPVSSLTSKRMVDTSRIHIYAWDARPYPAFPANTAVWGDGPNWRLGHWLNGRFASAGAGSMIAAILDDYGFTRYDTSAVSGTAAGFVIDRAMSAREAIQPFELAYFIDTIESDGLVRFRQRGADPAAIVLGPDDLVETKPTEPLLTLTRGQETDLPAAAKIRYISGASD